MTEQKVSMRVWSKDGAIRVFIPSSFVGPVNIYTGDGSVIPSEGISKRLSTFSHINKCQKGFLGDLKSAGYSGSSRRFCFSVMIDVIFTDDAASWTGSSLDIMTKDGSVRLFNIEELDSSNSKGFMRKLVEALWNA